MGDWQPGVVHDLDPDRLTINRGYDAYNLAESDIVVRTIATSADTNADAPDAAGLAIGPDDSVYFASGDDIRVWRPGRDVVTLQSVTELRSIDVGPDGTLFWASSDTIGWLRPDGVEESLEVDSPGAGWSSVDDRALVDIASLADGSFALLDEWQLDETDYFVLRRIWPEVPEGGTRFEAITSRPSFTGRPSLVESTGGNQLRLSWAPSSGFGLSDFNYQTMNLANDSGDMGTVPDSFDFAASGGFTYFLRPECTDNAASCEAAGEPQFWHIYTDANGGQLLPLNLGESTGDRISLQDAGFDIPSAIAVDSRGRIVISDTGSNQIYRLEPDLDFYTMRGTSHIAEPTDPSTRGVGTRLDPSGTELLIFDLDTGRHIETRNATSQQLLYRFEYDDDDGLLKAITDNADNFVTLTRSEESIRLARSRMTSTGEPIESG